MSAACASGRGQYCLCQFCRSAGEPGQRAFQLGEAPAVTQTTDEHRGEAERLGELRELLVRVGVVTGMEDDLPAFGVTRVGRDEADLIRGLERSGRWPRRSMSARFGR